jgi:sortase B
MKKNNNAERKPLTSEEKKRLIFLGAIAGFLLIVLVVLLVVFLPKDDVPTLETTKPLPTETDPTTKPSETTVPSEPTTEETTQPTEPEESLMLQELARLHEENSDLIGWVRIDGTMIDYPVMYTPYDGEKYIHKNFYGEYSFAGLPFLEDGCSLDPESENLIIYGHHMINGTMFENLMNYQQKSFWEDHPTIYFATLEEERTYEIFAVLKDRVYYQYEDVFKFYQFIEVDDEARFNEGMAYFKENSLYDTGITPQYGDRLITLVTCAYHHQYGRFVVLARLVED